MAADELHTLLESKKWVTHRVDRVEFLDLTTVRRTINLTVHARKLREQLPRGWRYPHKRDVYVPLGWFLPWANAGAVLLDADQRVIPYMTSAESDKLVRGLVERRLKRLAIREPHLIGLVEKVPMHRDDPAARGHGCKSCDVGERGSAYLRLMTERWGCRAVRELLEAVYLRRESGACDRARREARELAMILLAWQTNFVLLAPLRALAAHDEWATLQLSFDEELREWVSPLERGSSAKGDGVKLTRAERKRLRGRISRGGPFSAELDRLFPHHLRGVLARSGSRRLCKLGRRGLLRLTWHVAWHQASGLDTPTHQVDVILPKELMAVRVRMLRKRDGAVVANVADQVGSRATIVAPEVECAQAVKLTPPPPPPTLFSLSIAQRSTASWHSGAWIAGLTGLVVLATALLWLPTHHDAPTDAVTMLIVAPTLVAALLSVRAGSDLAEELTATLRPLIGAVGLLAAGCAVGILANQAGKPHMLSASGLKWVWVGCAILMLLIAVSLLYGARRIQKFIEVGRRASSRAVSPEDIRAGRQLNPKGGPEISPPDLWLDANEGEIVPWGWLDGKPDELKGGLPPYTDECFWQGAPREDLVGWVQELFCYTPPQALREGLTSGTL